MLNSHRRILERASRAPSGHNAQPWSVVINSEHDWTLHADQSRRLPAVDADDRELKISLGAFVESLVIAGAAEGFAVEVSRQLNIQLSPTTPSGDARELELRRTIRGPYETTPLSADDIAAMNEATYFASNTSYARTLRDATIEANRVQANRDDAQRELLEWIRWSRAEATSRRDGLSLAALGISSPVAWIAETFLKKERLLSATSRESQALDARKAIDGSAGWLIISGSDLIDTGRRLQRLWLKARARNIAIQPMSQALEELPWRNELDAQLILRVGYVKKYPKPVSLRRSPDSFVRS